MRAARLAGPRRFEHLEVETPTPQDGQVLVRMQRLSICGSDLRSYDRVMPEEDYPLRLGGPCHECVGVIEESRTDELNAGQQVIVFPSTSGGLVEYIVESPARIVPLPEGGDPSVWIMCQPVGTVIYSLQKIGSVLGQRVVILGQGPIGIAFADLMARQGASQVIVTDVLDYRLEASQRAGATHTINSAHEDVAAAVTEITGGEMADVAVEACGRPETAHQTFQVLKLHGRAALFGLTHDQDVFPFDWAAMYSKLPTIIATNSARAGDMPRTVRQCVDLVAQGRLDLSYLVTHRMAFDDVQKAYDTYSDKLGNSLKVVMEV